MKLWAALTIAAALLSLERIFYAWVWRHPDSFRVFCERRIAGALRDPVSGVRDFFYLFKALQAGVFVAWCYIFRGSDPAPLRTRPLALAFGLIVAGQILNLGVFLRLGGVGVFYGNIFGHELPRCEQFPFSILRHPQYVGALLSIWGLFLLLRFPHQDWMLLPMVETVYYGLGAHFEQ